ncbi:MAG: HlyD family efflux transporter periplasmic adaptor subunit [Phaeodactylibacter sp.]|nr:HlyD family efflux transporter periplasmic adaptor subunit [Phaeodactylibacter sp.]
MPEKKQDTTPDGLSLNREREEIQRILGYPPGWSLRWGITAVLMAVVIFLGIGWLVKYPDVITARVVVVTENPPVRLVARSSGKISRLLVADKQAVEPGQLIAVLENTAVLEDVYKLEKLVSQEANMDGLAQLLSLQSPEALQLGELQNAYASFQQALKDFQFFERQQGVFAQIASLEQQIQYLEGLNASLEQQELTLTREVEIAERSFFRNRGLLKSGAISQLELEQSETNYLQYRRQLESLQSQVLNNKLQAEQFKSQIIGLRQGKSSLSMEKGLAAREALERLKSELGRWKQTFLINTPAAGRISLSRIWSPQQFVQANEEVATVVPGAGSGDMVGKAFLPVFNSGKVHTGMRSNIQLDGYPYQEYGVLPGEVRSIALVPEQETFLLEIALSDSLVTTYGRTIPFAQELSGNARIITEDRRILDRVFDRLLSLLKNN